MHKRIFSACAVASLLALGAMAFGDGKANVDAAINKLAGAPNYSWTQSVEGGGGASGEGKVQSDGLTYVSFTLRNNTLEMYFNGDKGAVKTDNGWEGFSGDMAENGGGGGGMPDRTVIAARLAKNLKTPAMLAQDLAGKATDLMEDKNNKGVYTGTLPDKDAEALLRPMRRRGGSAAATVSNAKGSVEFTTDAGMLTKIKYHVSGTVSFNGNDRDVDRTSTVELKNIGKTSIDVPKEAKAKMESSTTEPS